MFRGTVRTGLTCGDRARMSRIKPMRATPETSRSPAPSAVARTLGAMGGRPGFLPIDLPRRSLRQSRRSPLPEEPVMSEPSTSSPSMPHLTNGHAPDPAHTFMAAAAVQKLLRGEGLNPASLTLALVGPYVQLLRELQQACVE